MHLHRKYYSPVPTIKKDTYFPIAASCFDRYYWGNVPGHEYFDGTVVSALERCVKPGREIFERLLSRFGLQADECMFVDDMQVNVDGAKRVGIHGFVFDGDINALRDAVNRLR